MMISFSRHVFYHLRSFCQRYHASWWSTLALLLLVLGVLLSLLAPWITPQNPFNLEELNTLDARLPPFSVSFDESMVYLLGTDADGRDLFSAVLYGLRTSLIIGVGAAFGTALIGSTIGLFSGYVGGTIDALLMRLVDFVLALPTILVALIILTFMGKGIFNVLLTIILIEWTYYARTIRAQTLVERQKEYVQVAIGAVLPKYRIILSHILPNCLPSILVIFLLQLARAITLEATLSFLGLGVSVTEPSLGMLISEGKRYMVSQSYWLILVPSITLLLLIASVNLVGDRLRVIYQPRRSDGQ